MNTRLVLIGLTLAAVPALAASTDKQDAVATLEQNVKTNPNNPELWIHLGFAYRKVEQVDSAQNAFQKALTLDPNNRDALSMLGLIYEKKHQNAQALQSWKSFLAVETDPAKREMAEKHIHQLQ